MHKPSTVTRFPPQLPVKQIATAAQALIDLLDALGGDSDIELNGDEGECNGDEGDVAWAEWDKLRGSQKHKANAAGWNEDDEDDEGGGDTSDDEGEPDFSRPRPGYGAGCSVSDPDHGAEEPGEVDEGACGHTIRYGVDQSRPLGPDNPEAA